MHMDFSLLTLHFRQAFFTFNFSFLIALWRLLFTLHSSLFTLHLNMLLANSVGDNYYNYFNYLETK